jgi:hypothetical protein
MATTIPFNVPSITTPAKAVRAHMNSVLRIPRIDVKSAGLITLQNRLHCLRRIKDEHAEPLCKRVPKVSLFAVSKIPGGLVARSP